MPKLTQIVEIWAGIIAHMPTQAPQEPNAPLQLLTTSTY